MGNRTRRQILHLMRDDERTVSEITKELELSQQAVSYHLSLLHRAGLVTERHHGPRRRFALVRDGLAAIQECCQDL